MRDGEWHLGYSASGPYPACALDFGSLSSGIYCLTEPEVKWSEPEHSDTPLPGEDGNRFGRDYQRTARLTFELGVDTVDRAPLGFNHLFPTGGSGMPIGQGTSQIWAGPPTPARRTLWNQEGVGMLRSAWRGDAVRRRTGTVAWIKHQSAGRVRTLYGRPRKFEVVHGRLTNQGYTPVLAEFEGVDDRFYDEEDTYAELYGRQLKGPGAWRPGRPTPPGESATGERLAATMAVRGRMDTYPWITLYGPGRSYTVSIDGLWSVELNLEIPSGQAVMIDARPWNRTVRHTTSGASVADKLTRASPRLAEMAVPPGRHTVRLKYLRGSGPSGVQGAPRVTIGWRSAHAWW